MSDKTVQGAWRYGTLAIIDGYYETRFDNSGNRPAGCGCSVGAGRGNPRQNEGSYYELVDAKGRLIASCIESADGSTRCILSRKK